MNFFGLFQEIVNDTLTSVEKKYGQGWLAIGMFFLLVGTKTLLLILLAMISWIREELGRA